MKRNAAYILILIIIAGAGLFFAYKTVIKLEYKPEVVETEDAVPVNTAEVKFREFNYEIDAVGTLKARETCTLSPKVSGNVNAVMADIGDRVKKGQVLVNIDDTMFKLQVRRVAASLEAAMANVAEAEAGFERAEKDYKRAKNLIKEKVIPQSRFDDAEAAFKAAKEGLSAAKSQHSQAKAALDTAKQHLDDTQIKSLISGVVVERNVEIGQTISPGLQVFLILDQTKLKADVDLPGIDFGRVEMGLPARIKIDAFPEESFMGKVKVINPMMDRTTRTFRVRIELPNSLGKLVDGMFARVKLKTGKKRALAVLRDALQRLPGSGTYYVFLIVKGKAVKRVVAIGIAGDKYAEVLEGLNTGDIVVTSGAGRLKAGMKVIVQDY